MRAFVFPGQGAQKVGMGKDLFERYPEARKTFERADEVLGFALSKLCFEGPAEELQLTTNAQPAILTSSIAVLRVVEAQTDLRADVVAGHSLGEYGALVCADALRFEDAVRIVHQRGIFMQEAVPVGVGAMAAVRGADPSTIGDFCQEVAQGKVLSPANFNAPNQIVISGHKDAVERAVDLAPSRFRAAIMLKVSAPFHCSLMEPAATRLNQELAKITFSEPRVPVVSNVLAEPNSDPAMILDLLTKQVTMPVRWDDSVRRMIEMGVTEFFELGGKPLSGMIRQIDKNVAANHIQTPDELADYLPNERPTTTPSIEWDPNKPGAFGF